MQDKVIETLFKKGVGSTNFKRKLCEKLDKKNNNDGP